MRAWLAGLDDEVAHLRDLAELTRAARVAPLEHPVEGLAPLLEEQARVCAALEQRRVARDGVLEASGGPRSRDLLVVVLGALPKGEHPEVLERFGRYVAAAEAAQREIEVNREFFTVALSAVEEALEARSGQSRSPVTYDARGGAAPPTSGRMSTLT